MFQSILQRLELMPHHEASTKENQALFLEAMEMLQDYNQFLLLARVSHRCYLNHQLLNYGESKGWITNRSGSYIPGHIINRHS